jgi:hypothetical protein
LARPDVADGQAVEPAEPPPYAGPWFDSPFFERLIERKGLSEEEIEQVERFARDGYIVLEPEQLGIDDLDAVATRIIEDMEPHYGDGSRVQDGWVISDAVRELALAPGVQSILELLYQRETVPFQTLNFKVGTQQDTHSDSFHFHCLPKFFVCGVWVALEDVDEDNGPLHYYRGSHRLPDVDVLDLGVSPVGNRNTDSLAEPYGRFVGQMLRESGLPRERLFARKGQALIWAANLYHGGDPIRDPSRTRHSQVTHFFFKNCVYYSPIRSDLALGKLAFRRPRNIRTRRYEPLRFDGRRIPIRLSDRMRWTAPKVMQPLRVWKKDSRRF